MDHICQASLPVAPWLQPAMTRLPGIQPLDPAEWLLIDDAFAAQMRLKDHLFETQRQKVYEQRPGSEDACAETLAIILTHLNSAYDQSGRWVCRPDGICIDLEALQPLEAAARLVQEDLCILEAKDAEHVLTAAALCFPASWTLGEKVGRPLGSIHAPVTEYTPDIARRVQRLFDRIQIGRPLWRQNALLYADPALFQPRAETAPRDDRKKPRPYLRSERQCLMRLPQTGAVVFSIHTFVVHIDNLTSQMRAGLSQVERAE
jgi:hypothetical protein